MKLVYSDGCRDPAYRTLAPSDPWREDINALVNNFDFRVFMFEDMQSGDSIIITAKVEFIVMIMILSTLYSRLLPVLKRLIVAQSVTLMLMVMVSRRREAWQNSLARLRVGMRRWS